MSIQKIDISTFTIFKDIEITFSKGCNIFIGENATGKTQLLKLLNNGNEDGQLTIM